MIPALSIIRVSGDGQDETTQRDSCQTAAEREGLKLVDEIQLHAVSGFKGDKRHLAAMDDALGRVRSGEVSAIVVAHSSRAARLPHRDVVRWQWDIEDAGGRLVSHDEATWARSGEAMDDAWSIMVASQNRKKSEDISDHVIRAFRRMDSEGYHRGTPLAGYAAEGTTQHKLMVKSPAAEFVVRAFLDCASGTSTPVIARMFRAECERRGWFTDSESQKRGSYRRYDLPVTDDGVRVMLRNPEYSTGHHKADAACQCRFQPLISPAQQRAAIASLEGRLTGPRASRAISKDDFSGAVFCGACGHVMYRAPGGSKIRKDGTRGPKTRRYVCQLPKGGCGKSVSADAADEAVNSRMAADETPWWIPDTTDPNQARDVALEAVKAALADLPNQGLDEDLEDAKRAELRAERKRLTTIPDMPAETFATRKTDDTGRELTEGDRWDRLTTAERRDMLTAGSTFAYVVAAPGRTGAVVVTIEREE